MEGVEEGGTTNEASESMTGAEAMRVDGVVVERAVDGVIRRIAAG